MPELPDIDRGCSDDQLARYLARVGHAGGSRADAALLAELHEAHLRAIAFENFEIQLGRPMRIEPDHLFEDLVDRRRGGYCFQMNELFARVLLRLGYRVERFAARVRLGVAAAVPPRSHQCLRVTDADGGRWFADVGFGGSSPLRPLRWEFDAPADHGIASYALRRDPLHGVVVRTRIVDRDWTDMISFHEHVQHPVDFRYANHAISTMPESRFVASRIASIVRGPERLNFENGTLRRISSTRVELVEIAPADEPALLREQFGLDLPAELPWLDPVAAARTGPVPPR